MILFMGFDRKKVNPLIYIKLWKQTCLPSLVFGSDLWSLTKTDIACFEHCQNWFIRKVFHLPKFSSVYFVKMVTWKIFLIFCLLALNLKINGLLFGIFSRKVSNSNYLEKNILLHFIENLGKPTTARLLLGAFLYHLIAILQIFSTSLLLYPIQKIYRVRQNMIREVLSS